MGTVARPYAFVKFDTFIQRTKKQYQDPRNQRNLQKLNEDLGVLGHLTVGCHCKIADDIRGS
jgi:hypothetical protein